MLQHGRINKLTSLKLKYGGGGRVRSYANKLAIPLTKALYFLFDQFLRFPFSSREIKSTNREREEDILSRCRSFLRNTLRQVISGLLFLLLRVV